MIYNLFMEYTSPEQSPDYERTPPMAKLRGPGRFMGASIEKKKTALGNYPKLKAICTAVESHPGMAKWLKERGPQGF